MAVIGWTVVGLVAGVVTTAMYRGHDTGGLAGALGVGVIGAVAGGGALAAGGLGRLGEFFHLAAWLIVFGVALLLLAAYMVLTHAPGAGDRPKPPARLRRTPVGREPSARRGVTATCRPVRTTPIPRSRLQAASCRRPSGR